ncbi:MAG: vWA domain-containing protein [Patescibacteria group bacterium]
MKKLLIGFGALAIALLLAPGFLAFEAHVVNVTAKIENALSVPIESIDFGTVFPQEQLNEALGISLSQSFMDEDRVDDVDYFIRQKPKCGITSDDGKILDHSSTATGHVHVGDVPQDSTTITQQFEGYYVDCGPLPRRLMDVDLPETAWNDIESYGMLPFLCPYISKHSDGAPANDGNLNSFHEPFQVSGNSIVWNDTPGHLAKAQNDTVDNWIIDLAVPCFGGECAQDWASFVNGFNPLANPDDYTQPTTDEHKIFGCDLWVEVGGISLPGLGCKGKIDLMLVVDESGSIGSTNMDAVKLALHSFIDALVLAVDGPNAGQTSFASIGVLDQELTSSSTEMHAAIDTLFSGGLTNLSAGIALANDEFNSVRDRADAPNMMIVITDGVPNVCYVSGCGDPAVEAAGYATVAKADGTEVFVVGIGSGVDATYLQTSIASAPSASHYFAGDFATLETTFADLIACEE